MPASSSTLLTRLAVSLVVLIVCATSGAEAARSGSLPPAVAKAVREQFPNARVVGYERERETGVTIYEVRLIHKGHRIEAEVDLNGSFGEIETMVDADEVPASVMVELRREMGDGRIIRVEKHDRIGVARNGQFVPLDVPRIFYEVKYRVNGRRREATVEYKPTAILPTSARESIAAHFPKAQIRDVQAVGTDDVRRYAVVLAENSELFQTVVAITGEILEVSDDMAVDSAPNGVKQAIEQIASSARVAGLERVEIKAVAEPEKVRQLAEPSIVFRARLRRGGQYADVTITPDGRTLEQPQWRTAADEDDEDGEDSDDREDKDE